jgi:hypothetical protein
MEYRINQFSTTEYAHVQSSLGHKVKLVDSIYWMQSRPFFYRPLLPFEALNFGRVAPPCRLFGGYQYAIDDECHANSTINFRLFEECGAYTVNALKSDFRRLINIAKRNFSVVPVENERELEEHGYKLYISFYNRTKYSYLSERTRLECFHKWIQTLVANPKTVFLGGYGEGELKAVGVCYWVHDMLLYSTFFSDTGSLKQHISDLMLHTVREMAAQQTGIKRILAGMYGGGIGPDRYYLLRGCRIERKPAHYAMTPSLAGPLLQTFAPAQFRKLLGHSAG